MLPENRLCECGDGIQDESHVLFDCSKTMDIRRRFAINRELYNNIGIMMDTHNLVDLIEFIDCCLGRF